METNTAKRDDIIFKIETRNIIEQKKIILKKIYC